jgi:hypothetical protein
MPETANMTNSETPKNIPSPAARLTPPEAGAEVGAFVASSSAVVLVATEAFITVGVTDAAIEAVGDDTIGANAVGIGKVGIVVDSPGIIGAGIIVVAIGIGSVVVGPGIIAVGTGTIVVGTATIIVGAGTMVDGAGNVVTGIIGDVICPNVGMTEPGVTNVGTIEPGGLTNVGRTDPDINMVGREVAGATIVGPSDACLVKGTPRSSRTSMLTQSGRMERKKEEVVRIKNIE